MSLKDALALHDPKLADVHSTPVYNPASDREALTRKIAETRDKFLATEPVRGRKDYTLANNVVAYTPTLRGGREVKIAKDMPLYIPAERFSDFLDKLAAAVSAGEADAALEASKPGTESEIVRPVRRAVKRENIGDVVAPREGGGNGWSEARREKYKQTIAAREAKKLEAV